MTHNVQVHRNFDANPTRIRTFARRQEKNSTVTIRRRGIDHSFKFHPIIATAMVAVCALVTVALIGSSAYLFLRNDLNQAAMARQARMQHAYEDRITALRAQVDLITSRQLLDQLEVENRVAKLLSRQNKIGALQQQVNKIHRRAGIKTTKRPALKQPVSKAEQSNEKQASLHLNALAGSADPFRNLLSAGQRLNIAHVSTELFDSLDLSLDQAERAELAKLQKLKKDADTKSAKLASILKKQGIRLPRDTAVGGPLIELKGGIDLPNSISALDESLDTLEKVRRAAYSLPHGSPTPGKRISSRFGNRRDPFTRSIAVHSGLDFRASRGSGVYATASGTITKAGRKGGYGKLVEIDHGGGITTRYAHLSRIKVKRGQRIKRGHRISNVGSTGRSTGPHLHYEVRRQGRVLNPISFVKLERRLKPYL